MSTSTARRVFYVPNEAGDATQAGYRRAFADLVAARLLDEVQIFSLERRIRAGGDAAAHRADLRDAVRRFDPDLLFMQHVGATGLGAADFAAITGPRRRFVYQEADPYTRWLHPLPRASAAAGRAADVVFTVGAGTFAANFRRAGARRIEWTPSAFDPARIEVQSAHTDRDVDVVMIANRSVARVRQLPSAGERVRFVKAAEEALGHRFALYGRDWTGPCARGPVPYSEQTRVLRTGWMSATWDHFAREPCYFSDRLAIALASGSIFATTLHPGYAAIFPSGATQDFLVTALTPERLVDAVTAYLRRTSPHQRLDAEVAARAFAWRHLRQDDTLVTMLNAGDAGIDPRAASSAWTLERTPSCEG